VFHSSTACWKHTVHITIKMMIYDLIFGTSVKNHIYNTDISDSTSYESFHTRHS
jgi:hypothetical protein